MSSIGTGYDLSASTFSPDGRIFQVEYALKATENTGLTIGLRGKDGVVLAVQKFVTTRLYEPTTNRRIQNVDQHVGFASAGLYPDGRALASYCLGEAQEYYAQYRSKVPTRNLADRVAMYMHAYTLYSAVRPFGSCILLSSWNKVDGPQLYMVDPMGLCFGYHGCAAGKNKQGAKTEIEKLKLSDMTLQDLVKHAAKIIYTVKDEKDKNFEVEMSWVGEATGGKHELVPKEITKRAEEDAKKALEEAESDDEMQH